MDFPRMKDLDWSDTDKAMMTTLVRRHGIATMVLVLREFCRPMANYHRKGDKIEWPAIVGVLTRIYDAISEHRKMPKLTD